MDTLQMLAPYADFGTNLRILRQRDAGEGLPAPARLDTCPAWCVGHTTTAPRTHRSHVLEVGSSGPSGLRRPIEVSVEAEQSADGTVGAPEISCDGRPMTSDQARSLAITLGIAASACDPASAAVTLDRPYGPYEAWRSMQGVYADAMVTTMQTPAVRAGEEFVAMALRLKAIWEALRLTDLHGETPTGRQLFHSINAAQANLTHIVDFLTAVDDAEVTLADLVNRPARHDVSARADQIRARRAETDPEAKTVKTTIACEPWCVIASDTCGCESYCMSREDVIAASAAGGRFDGETISMPCAEVFTSISYPEGLPSVQLIPRGPYAKSHTMQGWLELLPAEARQLATVLQTHAEQASAATAIDNR